MAETMRALAKVERAPGLRLIEAPIPTIGADEVLLQTIASSICGTDVHIYNWDAWSQSRIKPPVILGHEFSAKVVEVGRDVKHWKVDDYVSAEGHLVDWTCSACRAGQPHLCVNVKVIGVDRDGAFADYVAVPAENLWRNPDSLAPEIASLQDPFGNAVHTVFAFDLAGKNVLITGVGPIGLMAVPCARVAGAETIIVSDINDTKLELAKQLGADVTINPARQDLAATVQELTGDGADVLLEMSGAAPAITGGLAALRPGAEAALLGVPGRPFEIDWANLIVFKGLTVQAIYGRKIWDTWYRMKALLGTGAVNLQPLITHDLALEDFEKGFALMQSRDEVVGKVILRP